VSYEIFFYYFFWTASLRNTFTIISRLTNLHIRVHIWSDGRQIK